MADRRDSEFSTEMEQIPKKVAFHGHEPGSNSPLLKTSEPERNQFINSSRRHRTNLEDERVRESRAFRHDHMFRRPRALHYESLDDDSITMSPMTTRSRTRSSTMTRSSTVSSRTRTNTEDEAEERSTDNIQKQRSRLDLFVDLIWVGIIANISANFGEQAYSNSDVSVGVAVTIFLLLFIVIWRVWDGLRVHTAQFFVDDILQRNFTLWILVLAVLYGINAPFAYNSTGKGDTLRLLIVVYIIMKFSFVGAYGLQSIFLPFLRRQFWFQLIFTIISTGIWVGAIFCPYPKKLILLIVANAVEHPVSVFLASPTADRLLAKNMKRNPDVNHCVDRYEGFFIIILGEGVFRLIEGSPSGIGLNSGTGTVLTALLLYYIIHWLYFNGDQSKEYVHALRRTWWKPVLWQVFHVTMFGALLLLDASVLFLVKNYQTAIVSTAQKREESCSEPIDPADLEFLVNSAIWVASSSLGITVVCMTSIALLNRPLDPPKTLVINSRLIRIAPRIPVTTVIIFLPLIPNMTGSTWCGATVSLLYGVFLFEWYGGLERDWRFFERTRNE